MSFEGKHIHTFVINLDKRTDRLKYVAENLAKVGLDYQRVSAVDGSLLADEHKLINEDGFFIQKGRSATKGEIGCAESHRLIWKEMIDKDIPYALILEYDVRVDMSTWSILQPEVYGKFDFLNLSYTKPYLLDNKALKLLIKECIAQRPYIFSKWRATWKKLEGRYRRRIFSLAFLPDNSVICECDPARILASGYIVSLGAAKIFLEDSNSLSFPVDYIWRYSRGMLVQGFVSSPVVSQSFGDTNIEGRENNLNLSKKQYFKRLFLRNKRLKRKLDVVRMYGLRVL